MRLKTLTRLPSIYRAIIRTSILSIFSHDIFDSELFWDAENEKVASQARADAMNIMSEAIKADPNNLITLKWQYLQKIAEVAAESGTKIIIISDTSSPEITSQLPAAISAGLSVP